MEPLVVLHDDTIAERLLRDAATISAIIYHEMRPTVESIPSAESQTNPFDAVSNDFEQAWWKTLTMPTVDFERVPVARCS